MDASWTDLRLGLRILAKYPGLTCVGVASLSIAVAATAGVFAFTANFLKPTLPLEDGHRVVALQNWDVGYRQVGPASLGDYVEWRGELASVQDLGAFSSFERNLITPTGGVGSVRGAEITASAFRLARVPPLMGRTLTDDDEREGAEGVAVIGYGLWQSSFSGDAEVIGQTIRLDGLGHAVVGVMPEGFRFPLNHGLWVALQTDPLDRTRLDWPMVVIFGRLSNEVGLEEAQAELSILGRRRALELPDTHAALRPRVIPYAQQWIGDQPWGYLGGRLALLALLLVVCANVGALVFARTLAREGEFAVRAALGAGRARIVSQLFTEALVLCACAAAIGLFLASWGLGLAEEMVRESPIGVNGLPFWWQSGLTHQSVVLVGFLTVGAAAVCGLVPALMTTRHRVWMRLQRSSSSGASVRVGRGAKIVIASQFGLSVGLLTLAVAEWPDFVMNEAGISGLAPDAYVTAELRPARPGFERAGLAGQLVADRESLASRLDVEPGVMGFAFAGSLPGMVHPQQRTEVEGASDDWGRRTVRVAQVDANFFDVLGVPFKGGRGFDPSDFGPAGTVPAVAVANEAFVAARLGGGPALGQRVRFVNRVGEPGPWLEVVGVVADFGMNPIDPSRPEGLYVPLGSEAGPVMLVIRVAGEAAGFTTRLRSISADASQAYRLARVRPLSAVLAVARGQRRTEYAAITVGTLGILLLSLGGVYAIMSFFVSRRIREVGIRTALGARPSRVTFDIYRRAAVQLGWGVVAGIAVTLVLSSVALEGGSPAVVLKVSVVMIMTGLLACAAPTLRLLRVHPSEAMRVED